MTTTELAQYLRSRFASMKTRYPKQLSLATEWAEAWNGGEYGAAGVESRVSELFNAKPDGIKFFFSDPARSKLLFDLLEVPSDKRLDCAKIADAALSGRVEPRLAVDLRHLDEPGFKLACGWLERELLAEARHCLLPAVLLVTPTQRDEIPRRFDQYKNSKQLVWRDDSETDDGQAGIPSSATMLLALDPRDHAQGGATWAWSRWAQFDVQAGAVVLDPADALDRLAEGGAVSEVRPAGTRLAELGVVADSQTALAWLARTRRPWRATVELHVSAAHPAAGLDPEMRMGLAALFDLEAGATGGEVIDHEIALLLAELGLKACKTWTSAELQAYLARAKIRPVEPVVVRVGAELHAVNCDWAVGKPDSPRLVLHDVVCAEPAIDALKARLALRTNADLDDDPNLDGMIDELVAQGQDRLALQHARAALYVANKLGPPPAQGQSVVLETRIDWRQAILDVTSHAFTHVELRVASSEEATLHLAKPGGKLDVPTPGPTVVARGGAEVHVMKWKPAYEYNGYSSHRPTLPQAWKVFLDSGVAGALWLDNVEQWKADEYRKGPGEWEHESTPAVTVDWHGLDALCAMLCARLRHAALEGHAVAVGDGSYMLPVGGGIVTRIDVMRRRKILSQLRVRVAGSVPKPDYNRKPQLDVDWKVVATTHGAAICGPRVPSLVVLDAGDLRLELTFHADPFTAGRPGDVVAVAAAVKAAERRAADAARNDDD